MESGVKEWGVGDGTQTVIVTDGPLLIRTGYCVLCTLYGVWNINPDR